MRFKTTQNIFKDFGEHFDPNWMDSDSLILPPKKEWDYKRPMQIEDVDLWEVIYEQGGSVGVYAAYNPFAEFYMIRVGWFFRATRIWGGSILWPRCYAKSNEKNG
jgi:hypothetical protein